MNLSIWCNLLVIYFTIDFEYMHLWIHELNNIFCFELKWIHVTVSAEWNFIDILWSCRTNDFVKILFTNTINPLNHTNKIFVPNVSSFYLKEKLQRTVFMRQEVELNFLWPVFEVFQLKHAITIVIVWHFLFFT